MGWAKLDDARALNKKLARAGFAARGLDEACICLAARDETDGFISDDDLDVVARVHRSSLKAVAPLVRSLLEVGRWTRDDERGGIWIHDYLDFNPSHQAEEERRERERTRKANSRSRHDRADTGQFRPVSHPDNQRDTNGTTGGHPPGLPEESHRNPSRPVPTRLPPSGSTAPPTDAAGGPDGRTDGPIETIITAQAFRILAERRANLGSKPIANRPSWLKATVAGLAAEYPDAAELVTIHGFTSGEQLANWLEPPRKPVVDGMDGVAAAARAGEAKADLEPCETCGARGGGGFVELEDGFVEPCPACGKAAVK